MSGNPFGFEFKPVKIAPIGFGPTPSKKKRKSLSAGDRLYIWERPKKYGRVCSICYEKITKQSNLELDHTRAHSKGGTKLALAHRDCNRRKSSGSLRRMQKRLGIQSRKKKSSKKSGTKRKATRKPANPWGFPQFRI